MDYNWGSKYRGSYLTEFGSGIIQGNNINPVSNAAQAPVIGYLVEGDGTIKIPYLDRVKVVGLTRLQLEDTLTQKFKSYTKDPVVNVRFLNYRVTVLGEVNHPGGITIPNERLTVLEALSLAGDLTIQGERQNVLVIREVNGVRSFGRINLLSKDIFSSPYFYLKTNDVVYVQPGGASLIPREKLPTYIVLTASALSILLTIIYITKA